MDDDEFVRMYLAVYNRAIREGNTVVTETVQKGLKPEGKTFDGRRIKWRVMMNSAREKEITWIGIGEKEKL